MKAIHPRFGLGAANARSRGVLLGRGELGDQYLGAFAPGYTTSLLHG